MSRERPFQKLWLAALALFVLAGATGSLLRFGMLHGYPWQLQMTNIRHAHSHLMYFGWVTPALMALIAAYLPSLTGRERPRGFRIVIIVTLAASLLAYIPFLLYGYRPAEIGTLHLPLAVMGAGLNIFTWYAFILLYLKATRGIPRHHPLRLWDAALGFLVLASLGAWALALASLLGIHHPFWNLAMTHLFLDLFADGWFVLALLGIIYAGHPAAARHPAASWGENLLVIGLPVTFLLSMPASAMPLPVRLLAGLGGLAVALGLFSNLWALVPALRRSGHPAWVVPLFFLGLKAVAGLGISLPAGAQWASQMALRVSYLHWLLLGFITLGLVEAASNYWGRSVIPGRQWFRLSTLLLILSLIPLSGLWPPAWGGRWALQAAAWATLGPVLVALFMLGSQFTSRRKESQPVLSGLQPEKIM